MVIVNPRLIEELVASDPWLYKAYELIIGDTETRTLWEMSNVMVVNRLKYNDHGPVHALITAGSAVYIYKNLLSNGVESTLIRDGVVDRVEYAVLIPLYGAFLHDIGNSIHRDLHEKLGSLLARPILDRLLAKLIPDERTRIRVRQEIMHSIHCTAYDVECLTLEAGCVKVGDGLDMAEGRARIPYKLGGVSIHSVSALSINKVEIIDGIDRPIRINIYMDEKAGIFQVDDILLPKIKSTPLKKYLEVYAIVDNSILKKYLP